MLCTTLAAWDMLICILNSMLPNYFISIASPETSDPNQGTYAGLMVVLSLVHTLQVFYLQSAN